MLNAATLSGPSRRIRMDLKCSPGNKACGERCIPQEYECGGQDGGQQQSTKRYTPTTTPPPDNGLPSATTVIGAGAALGALGFAALQNKESILKALKPQKLTRQQQLSNTRGKALGEFANAGTRMAVNALKIGFGGPVGKVFGVKGLIDNSRQLTRAAKNVGGAEAEMVNRNLTAGLLRKQRRQGQLKREQASEYLRRKKEGFNVTQRKELAGVESSITTATRQARETTQQVGEAYGSLRDRGRKAETAAQTAAFNLQNNLADFARRGREREEAFKQKLGNWFGLSKRDSLDLVCWDSLNPEFQERILSAWRSYA